MGNCFGLRRNSQYLLESQDYDDNDTSSVNTETPVPTYHINPGIPVSASDLTEEEQIKIVQRIHILQLLPSAHYFPINKKKLQECIICMNDLKIGDEVRYLPCLHTYHRSCIDEWLMRSLSCPTCLMVIEASTFQNMEHHQMYTRNRRDISAIPVHSVQRQTSEDT